MMEVGKRTATPAADMAGFWLPSGFLDDGQFPGGEETFGGDRFSPAATGATTKVEDEVFFSGEVARRNARPSLGSKSPSAVADAFGLLSAGAGEIAGTRSPSPTSSFPRSGYYPSHASTLQHIQRQREKELIKHQLAAAAAWVRRERAIRDAGRAAAVVPWLLAKRHQQHHQIGVGSGGTRAFFFSADGGGSGGRNASAGTGVFLPRGAAASEQQRKKSATAATSPAVVQALDLTLAELAVNPRFPCEIHVGAAVPSPSKNPLPIAAAHSDLGVDASAAAADAEISLPPEWIY